MNEFSQHRPEPDDAAAAMLARAEFAVLAFLESGEAVSAFAAVRDRLRPGTSSLLHEMAAALERPGAGAAAADALAAAADTFAGRALADELRPYCTTPAAQFALARLITDTTRR
ncbi:hypothetical protein BJF84_15865 [Rhodococcus sp. CUA-806]|jgi:hypothetical protein|nr:hypothetical protein BJF84_15865 [Rhodococcus sp. CUA-806]